MTSDSHSITTDPAAADVRILLADDVDMMRELLKGILRSLGFAHFSEAANGEEATSQYFHSRPDLVFLDIDMPVKDGWQALTEMRAHDSAAYIIMISGHGGVEDIQQASALGASGYIVKPFAVQKVAQCISSFTQKKLSTPT